MIVACPFCGNRVNMDPSRCVYHGGDRGLPDPIQVSVCPSCAQPWVLPPDGRPRRLSRAESERFRPAAEKDQRFMAMVGRVREKHEKAHWG